MSRVKKRTPLQRALIELRQKLGHSQESLARALNVSLPTIGKWESMTEPKGISLALLEKTARENQLPKVAAVFQDALDKLKTTAPRDAQAIHDERMRWTALDEIIGRIQQEAEALKEKKNPAGQRIYDDCNAAWLLLEEIHSFSWRNR
jgi:transcriptional regulator with XRE-family HTH domain